jgi:hypothetical protein
VVIKKEGKIKYSIIITHTHTQPGTKEISERNEINHSLGVRPCVGFCVYVFLKAADG